MAPSTGSRVKNRWLSPVGGRLQLERCPPTRPAPPPWPQLQPSSPPSGQATPVQGDQLPKSHPQPRQDTDQLQALPLPLEPPLGPPGTGQDAPPGPALSSPSLSQGLKPRACPHPPAGLWTHTPGLGTCPGQRNLLQSLPTYRPCSPHETSTTRAESHLCPLTSKPQTQAEVAPPGPPQCNARSQCTDRGRPFHRLMTHTLLP